MIGEHLDSGENSSHALIGIESSLEPQAVRPAETGPNGRCRRRCSGACCFHRRKPSTTRRSRVETTGRDGKNDFTSTASDETLVGEWVELALEAPSGDELGRMLRHSQPE